MHTLHSFHITLTSELLGAPFCITVQAAEGWRPGLQVPRHTCHVAQLVDDLLLNGAADLGWTMDDPATLEGL